MPTQREIIKQKALEILENYPNGIRYSELLQNLKDKLTGVPENTIVGNIGSLKNNELIIKPERGWFLLRKYLQTAETPERGFIDETMETGDVTEKLSEDSFYQPFANFLLINELDECTAAIPLGGKRSNDTWETPDVIGVYIYKANDPMFPPNEIISAEIKVDTKKRELLYGFGQACTYKLFSHKVYLVIPQNSENLDRIEALCLCFGIGLILFDKSNKENPNFIIRNRAIKSNPEYYYVKKLFSEMLKPNELNELFRYIS